MVREAAGYDFSLLKFTETFLCPTIWCILENVPCALVQYVNSAALGFSALKISINTFDLVCH